MNVLTRARIYITRKKTKSFLLLGIFIVMCCTLMITSFIKQSVNETMIQIKENAHTKVIALSQEKHSFSKDTIESIEKIKDVSLIHKKTTQFLSSENFKLLYEEKTTQIPIISFEYYEKDGLFFDGSLTLRKGQLPSKEKNEIMIHETVANLNNLTLGDNVTLSNIDKEAKCTIVGIYISGNEDMQDIKVPAHLRIENQIYASIQVLEEVNIDLEYDELYIYTKNPDELLKTENMISKLLGQQFSVSSSDVFYQQMKIPLEQTNRMVSMIRMITFVSSCFVIALILSMWVRTRVKEIGIYMSIGQSKIYIYGQMMLESLILYSVAVIISMGLTGVISRFISMDGLEYISLSLMKQIIIYLKQALVGFIGVFLAISISMYPIMKMTPQSILIRMEE